MQFCLHKRTSVFAGIVVLATFAAACVFFVELGVRRSAETDHDGVENKVAVATEELRAFGVRVDLVPVKPYYAIRGIQNDKQASQLTHFDNIKYLSAGGYLSGSSLKIIGNIYTLEHLSINCSGQNLRHLNGLPNLSHLTLYGNKITDAGLSELRTLDSLRKLNLERCQSITDSAGEHIKEIPYLETLNLAYTRIGDSAMRHFAQMKNLRGISLSRTLVTDAGLADLSHSQTLRELNLTNTAITDVGLRELQAMPSLEGLSLRSPLITDKGLLYLQKCKGLKKLGLCSKTVSAESVFQLRGALPDLDLSWNPTK